MTQVYIVIGKQDFESESVLAVGATFKWAEDFGRKKLLENPDRYEEIVIDELTVDSDDPHSVFLKKVSN